MLHPHVKRLLLPCLVFVLLVAAPLEKPLEAADAGEQVLSASIRIDVDWHDYNPDGGNIVEDGSCSLQISGTIVKTGEEDFLSYIPKNLIAAYSYSNRGIDTNPSEGCPELYEETFGSGSAKLLPVDEVSSAGGAVKDGCFQLVAFTGDAAKTYALQLSGNVSLDAMMNIAQQPEVEIYTFGMQALMKVTRRTRNLKPCSSYRSESFDMPLDLHLLAAEIGGQGMKGSYTWTSDRRESGMTLYDFGGEQRFGPEKKAGAVRYRASWKFEVPYVTIWRETDRGWTEITGNVENVLIGEKLKLKAVVNPSGTGKWSVPGKLIQEFDGGTTPPRITEPDLTGEIIEFAWVDGSTGGKEVEVEYNATAEGKQVSGSAAFKVFEPGIDLEADIAPRANLGFITLGGSTDFELFLGPNNHKSGMHIAAKVDLPMEFADREYRVQFVQLLESDSWAVKNSGQLYQPIRSHIPANSLDGVYPYPSERDGDITYMNDTPGGPFSLVMRKLYIHDTFDTYVMFMPSGPGGGRGVWVPVRRVHWEWMGAAEGGDYSDYYNLPDKEANAKRSKQIPTPPPTAEESDTDEYPNWTSVHEEGKYDWKDEGDLLADPGSWTPPGRTEE